MVWDVGTNSAYYVDFGLDSTDLSLHCYDAGERKTYSAYVKGPSRGNPSFIIPIKSSGSSLRTFAVGFSTNVGIVEWDGYSDQARFRKEVFNIADRLGPKERLAFGHRDSTGAALYAGSLSAELCVPPANQSVYVKVRGSPYSRVLTDVHSSTGWGFVHSNGLVYVLDTCSYKIYAIPELSCTKNCGKQALFDFRRDSKLCTYFLCSLQSRAPCRVRFP